ncbi:PREDICTED: molybdopterin synthase sulfur carrier subunit-like [Charadrius vociferus]|uniref:molybdopterin synthase sulfur carrier subunit-like n=1 Tax=Charadrius vociferus TaxID=50402 RepID=UPI0005219250|nr:PREDICTED: molybdopterin synthase sulfur carrier subunit-like [Charadrius vociferus]
MDTLLAVPMRGSAATTLTLGKKENTCCSACDLPLGRPRQVTALQLWEEIVKVHPRLAVIQDQVVFAVRQEYVLLGDQLLVLQPGDEVAIIPPISGG